MCYFFVDHSEWLVGFQPKASMTPGRRWLDTARAPGWGKSRQLVGAPSEGISRLFDSNKRK